ncbi:MAG: pilus assembly protein [Alphaproteobacteria bacterium]|nr:pilus assembly protein [Alphaproteobacteria bacterium]
MRTRYQRSRRRGSAAIEFAFWLPVVMVMLSGIIDFGWYMSRSEIVMRAARDGARQGAAAQLAADFVSDADAQANSTLSALGYGGCNVSTTQGTDANSLTYLATTVDCPYSELIGMAPGLPTNIMYKFTMYTELQ